MGLTLLTERHHHQIAGVLSCYVRILIQGTLPGLCYAEGMTSYLCARQIRIFDYPRFAQPLRDHLRENAERLAAENGLKIEFIRRTKSFRKEEKVQQMQAIYGTLTRTAIHTVKPDNVATFLGRKLHPLYQGEVGNRFNTRIEGTRIKHTMGWVSIKMYDKFGRILRIETTVNDVSFFGSTARWNSATAPPSPGGPPCGF